MLRQTPARALAEAATNAIISQWNELRANGLSNVSVDELRKALRYLNAREKRAEQIVFTSVEPKETASRDNSATVTSSSQVVAGIVGATGLALVVVLIGFIIYVIATHLRESLIVGLVIAILVLMMIALAPALMWIGDRIGEYLSKTPRIPVLSLHVAIMAIFAIHFGAMLIVTSRGEVWSLLFVLGILAATVAFTVKPEASWALEWGHLSWLYAPLRSELESERFAIMNALNEATTRGVSSGSDVADDEDETDQGGVPAPPGITEIVLDADEQATFTKMRKYLDGVRIYHRTVLWALIVSFLAFLGFGLAKFVQAPQTLNDYLQAFGSAGVGGLLLWYGQRTLWADRVSQVSLALFESYIAEVSSSLKEIPSSATADERRRARAAIWSNFRVGLNRLWISERDALPRTPSVRARQHSKNPSSA